MVVTGMNSSLKSIKFFRFLYRFGGLCFILPFPYRIALDHSAQTEKFIALLQKGILNAVAD